MEQRSYVDTYTRRRADMMNSRPLNAVGVLRSPPVTAGERLTLRTLQVAGGGRLHSPLATYGGLRFSPETLGRDCATAGIPGVVDSLDYMIAI